MKPVGRRAAPESTCTTAGGPLRAIFTDTRVAVTRPVAGGVSKNVAGPTRLELATSGVTGRRSNQLNYGPAFVRLRPGFGGQPSPRLPAVAHSLSGSG